MCKDRFWLQNASLPLLATFWKCSTSEALGSLVVLVKYSPQLCSVSSAGWCWEISSSLTRMLLLARVLLLLQRRLSLGDIYLWEISSSLTRMLLLLACILLLLQRRLSLSVRETLLDRWQRSLPSAMSFSWARCAMRPPPNQNPWLAQFVHIYMNMPMFLPFQNWQNDFVAVDQLQ